MKGLIKRISLPGLIVLIVIFGVQCRQAQKVGDQTQGNQEGTLPQTEKATTPPQIETEPPPSQPAKPQLSPMEAIKELDKKIESYKTGSNLTPEEIEYNRKLKQEIIRGTFNLQLLSKLALASHWTELSVEQRDYFVDLMTRLLEKKAIFSKEQIKGDSKAYYITYQKEEFLDPEKNTAQVSTKITVPSEKIDLNINYKLSKASHEWNIFDVIVDDASLVENYKFQFNTIIKKYGYQDLVNRMEKKLKEME